VNSCLFSFGRKGKKKKVGGKAEKKKKEAGFLPSTLLKKKKKLGKRRGKDTILHPASGEGKESS